MTKKIIKISSWVLSATIFLLAVLTVFSVFKARMNNDVPRIFGFSFHLVLTDSMSPEIVPDDFVLAKKVKKSDIKKGDYIVFYSLDPKYQDPNTGKGLPIIHKVIEITSNGNFMTQGIKEGAPIDEGEISHPIGKFVLKSTFLGKVIKFFSKITNIIFAVIVIILLFVTIKYAKKFIKAAKEKE